MTEVVVTRVPPEAQFSMAHVEESTDVSQTLSHFLPEQSDRANVVSQSPNTKMSASAELLARHEENQKPFKKPAASAATTTMRTILKQQSSAVKGTSKSQSTFEGKCVRFMDDEPVRAVSRETTMNSPPRPVYGVNETMDTYARNKTHRSMLNRAHLRQKHRARPYSKKQEAGESRSARDTALKNDWRKDLCKKDKESVRTRIASLLEDSTKHSKDPYNALLQASSQLFEKLARCSQPSRLDYIRCAFEIERELKEASKRK